MILPYGLLDIPEYKKKEPMVSQVVIKGKPHLSVLIYRFRALLAGNTESLMFVFLLKNTG